MNAVEFVLAGMLAAATPFCWPPSENLSPSVPAFSTSASRG